MSDFQGCGVAINATQSADFQKVYGKVYAKQIQCKFMQEKGLNSA